MILSTSAGATAGVIVLLLFIVGLYFVPTIVALIRRHHQTGAVLVINLLLGWTLIGWAVALAMAVSAHRQPQVVVQQLVASPSSAPPPGWYSDPEHPGQERWWGGTTWADEYRPAGGGPTPPADAT